jgi:hypothetical protein
MAGQMGQVPCPAKTTMALTISASTAGEIQKVGTLTLNDPCVWPFGYCAVNDKIIWLAFIYTLLPI